MSDRPSMTLAAILTIAFPSARDAAHGEVRYHVTDLGALGTIEVRGFDFELAHSMARGINERGQIVGRSFNAASPEDPVFAQVSRAFLWDRIHGMQDLGALGTGATAAFESDAVDVNESGVIVGSSRATLNVATRVVIWPDGGPIADVGVLGNSNLPTFPASINDLGQIVGAAGFVGFPVGVPFRGFRWDEAIGFHSLLDDGIRIAQAVNNVGQIAGQAVDPVAGDRMRSQAILWDPSAGMKQIVTGASTFGWTVPDCSPQDSCGPPDAVLFFNSMAADVNEHAHVVGWARAEFRSLPARTVAFHWQNDILAPLPAGNLHSTQAEAINNIGQIVGWGELASEQSDDWQLPTNERALLWEGGALLVLNDLIDPVDGWWLQRANDVNDRGEIVGWGRRNGLTRAFLLSPAVEVPEPATSALEFVALIVGVALGRRRPRDL